MKEILLTQGYVALVDDEDFDWLNQYKWSIASNGYPQRATKTEKGWRPRRMHRDILKYESPQVADHINGNKLDNRRSNLRIVNRQQNNCNTGKRPRQSGVSPSSQFKGVCWLTRPQRWGARIRADGKYHTLGTFKDEVEAARAYDAAARVYHGEFAKTNFKENDDAQPRES